MSAGADEHDIAGVGDLGPGQSLTFGLECAGRRIEAFLINFRGRFHAYVNRCRHVPMTLDWVENQFFSTDGKYLVCATHGAYYEPDSGECVDGPPCGRLLFRVPLRVSGDRIFARCPTDAIE
jgi:nitrite reductase/ring-hydroxylating ferredoxin subunit